MNDFQRHLIKDNNYFIQRKNDIKCQKLDIQKVKKICEKINKMLKNSKEINEIKQTELSVNNNNNLLKSRSYVNLNSYEQEDNNIPLYELSQTTNNFNRPLTPINSFTPILNEKTPEPLYLKPKKLDSPSCNFINDNIQANSEFNINLDINNNNSSKSCNFYNTKSLNSNISNIPNVFSSITSNSQFNTNTYISTASSSNNKIKSNKVKLFRILKCEISDKLRNKLIVKNLKVSELKNKINKLDNLLLRAKTEYSMIKDKEEAINFSNNLLNQNNKIINLDNSLIDSERQALISQINNFQHRIIELQEENKKIQENIDIFNDLLSSDNETCECLSESISNLIEEKKCMSTTLIKLIDINNKIKNNIDKMDRKSYDIEDKIKYIIKSNLN